MRITPSRLTALVALPFVLVLVADVVDTWLERRNGERNVLIGAPVRFEPRDRVVRLANLADGAEGGGITLGAGWAGQMGGGLGVSQEGASVELRLPVGVLRSVIIEARQRRASDGVTRLRARLGGVEIGTVDLDRDWGEATFEIPPGQARNGAVELRFESVGGDGALIRRIGVAAEPGARLDDLDRNAGMEHDPGDGWLTVSRPGRAVIEVDAAPVPSRLVARVRFLPQDGRLPVGHARLAVSRARTADSDPVAAAELDASEALWRDLSLDVPQGEPVQLVITVPTLGDGDTLVLESLWRRPE